MSEKDTNPKDAIGTKKWRQFTVVPFQVIWEVGIGMLEGALKYGRHNYRASGVRASVYVDAALGHIHQFWEGEDLDPDSRAELSHITKAICSLVVLRDAMMNDFYVDDRPPKIKNLKELRAKLQLDVESIFEEHGDRKTHHYTDMDDGAPYRKTMIDGVEVSEGDVVSYPTPEALASGRFNTTGLKVGEIEKWGASEADVQDEEILALASEENVSPDSREESAEALLERMDKRPGGVWLPLGPVEALGSDDPSRLAVMSAFHPDYDVEHIAQGLTQKQLDRLVLHEGKIVGHEYREYDSALYDALLRRVLLRIRSQPARYCAVWFTPNKVSLRTTRLNADQWTVASPGAKLEIILG